MWPEAKIDNTKPWKRKQLSSIQMCYSRAKYYKQIYTELEEIYSRDYEYLIDFNEQIIRYAFKKFNINIPIYRTSKLIKKGKVFSLGIPLDREGPQNGLFGGRFNPIHQMLATGTDAVCGRQDWNKIRYADDTLNLCVQGATHWDALGHIFYEDRAYNGHDPKQIDVTGLNVLGIENSKDKMNGRGVLLDIARYRGVDWLQDGEGISNDELDACAQQQGVDIKKADFVIIRTGQMERCLSENEWGGYAGGDAPGVKFENCYWCHEKEVAAICSDTWGVEVRPN